MAKHVVKCSICGESFDTNLIQAVRSGARRYAHATCLPQCTDFVPLGEEADPDLIKLKDYIQTLFGDKARWPQITSQIKKYHDTQGYSYSGMLKSLIYFYEVQRHPTADANGAIGIIPYVYQDAYNYYLSLFMAQQAISNNTFVTKEKVITIKPPQMRGLKRKLLDWSIEDEE